MKTDTGVIVGAKGFHDEYDANTLEQVEGLTGKAPKIAKAEGFEGKNNAEKR
ncbi:hypothetical protein [Peijinzhouia sedimentorum]